MSTAPIENEIIQMSARIEERETSLNNEVESLTQSITFYSKGAWILILIGALIAVITIAYFLIAGLLPDKFSDLGSFLSGGVASTWSLAGLFFIYVAFLGQKQQLLHQQLEIMYNQLEVKYTRLELNGQKEEMMAQNQTLRHQKFENTFFQLVTLYNSIINSIDLRNRRTREVTQGRDCFETFYNSFRSYAVERNRHIDTNIDLDIATQGFEEFYNKYKSDTSHYFRTIYHIVKFIDSSEIEDKKQYISIIRAQLSSYEQVMLFYNCLHDNGIDKFKPLIEKYALFKNIDRSLLINNAHWDEYEEGAYGH